MIKLSIYRATVLHKIEEFKDFSRLLSDFQILFKAYLIFTDFSKKPSRFKYFSSQCEPCGSKFVVSPILCVLMGVMFSPGSLI